MPPCGRGCLQAAAFRQHPAPPAKGDYLTSAGIVLGIEVVYEDGVLQVTLPGLLPKRAEAKH